MSTNNTEKYKLVVKCVDKYLNNEPYMKDAVDIFLGFISEENKQYMKQLVKEGFKYINYDLIKYVMSI